MVTKFELRVKPKRQRLAAGSIFCENLNVLCIRLRIAVYRSSPRQHRTRSATCPWKAASLRRCDFGPGVAISMRDIKRGEIHAVSKMCSCQS